MRKKVEPIESKAINKLYKDSFKRKLVEKIEAGFLTTKEARLKYGVCNSVLQYWICLYGKDAEERAYQKLQELRRKTFEISESNRLNGELRMAQMELELYKNIIELTKKQHGIDLKKTFGLWL
jgi:hypothetical protein